MISKLPYYDLYESVRSVIFENLKHKHPYVRKNALSCISTTLEHFGEDSLPTDINEILIELIEKDPDHTVVRNAYLTLAKVSPEESLNITKSILQKTEISEMNDLFLLSIVGNLKNIAKTCNPSNKAKIVRVLVDLLQQKSYAVLFEIAYSLLEISSNSTVIKQAVSVLSNLLIDINDNNTIMIIIKKLNSLKLRYKQILEENVITYTNLLNKSDLTLNIRSIILEMISDIVTENNINQVFHLLKQQYNNMKSTNDLFLDFKYKILECLFTGFKKYPNVNKEYIHFLIEKSFFIISNKNKNYKEEQCNFIKEVFFLLKDDCSLLYEIALKHFEDISNQDMLITIIYILSEYSMGYTNLLKSAFNKLIKNIGDLDLVLKEEDSDKASNKNESNNNNSGTKTITKTVVLKDGSYGTETITVNLSEYNKKDQPFLRENLLNSNYFFVCNVAVSITKIYFNLVNSKDFNHEEFNDFYFRTINVLCSLVKLDSYKVYKDQNSIVRINLCLELVMENNTKEFFALSNEVNEAYNTWQNNIILSEKEGVTQEPNSSLYKNGKKQLPGNFISFRQVTPYDADNLGFIEEEIDDDNTKLEEELDLLINNNTENLKESDSNIKKTFVETLTGSEDSLQVEAVIEIFTFDIVIDFRIKNRSKQDYQNILLEIFAPTNLEIIEKAPAVSLKSGEETKVRSCIKFSSSCNSFIFGEISFSDYRGYVYSINLSGVFINLLDTYAASCTVNNFRKCWMNYSWEHKTLIVTKNKSFKELITEICSKLSLKLIVPKDISAIEEDSAFLVSNLYTKSKLGEDALINISLEKVNDKKIVGCAVIRSQEKEFAQFQGERIKSLIK